MEGEIRVIGGGAEHTNIVGRTGLGRHRRVVTSDPLVAEACPAKHVDVGRSKGDVGRPKAERTGDTHPHGQMSMDRVLKEYSAQELNARFFTDPDEAMEWLEKQ